MSSRFEVLVWLLYLYTVFKKSCVRNWLDIIPSSPGSLNFLSLVEFTMFMPTSDGGKECLDQLEGKSVSFFSIQNARMLSRQPSDLSWSALCADEVDHSFTEDGLSKNKTKL